MTEHRVSVLGATLRRYEDPEQSRDPRVQTVLAQLKSVQIAPEPRAHFRAELRAQLVAVAPRIIAESAAENAAAMAKTSRTAKATVTRTAAERRRGFSLGRPLAVAAGVACAFLVLLGGAVWMSQKSLPGDSLYGLKRASENVRLAMATTDAEKAQEYLDLAATRVDEANDLVAHTSAMAAGSGTLAGGMSAGTKSLVTGNLTSANSDVTSASSLLGAYAVKTHAAGPLATLTTWAPTQQKRLKTLAAAVGDPALKADVLHAAGVVKAASLRATTLEQHLGATCLRRAATDQFGPKPCIDRGAGVPPAPVTTTGRPATKPAPGPTVPNVGRVPTAPKATAPRVPGAASTTAGPGLPTVPTPLPIGSSLPVVKVPPPLTITSCSISVIGVPVLTCPSATPTK